MIRTYMVCTKFVMIPTYPDVAYAELWTASTAKIVSAQMLPMITRDIYGSHRHGFHSLSKVKYGRLELLDLVHLYVNWILDDVLRCVQLFSQIFSAVSASLFMSASFNQGLVFGSHGSAAYSAIVTTKYSGKM